MKFIICSLILINVFSFDSFLLGENESINLNLNFNADSIEINNFIPDTSINGKLFLNNPHSIEMAFGNIMANLNKDENFAYIYILNVSKQEYLKLVFFPGNTINSISQFEVGYVSSIPNRNMKRTVEMLSFITENKIQLGMTKEEIIEIKGKGFIELKEGKAQIIRYVLKSFDKSSFLKRYNMPVYLEEFWIKDNKLIKYHFGFEYP